jgi:hypothetical protein
VRGGNATILAALVIAGCGGAAAPPQIEVRLVRAMDSDFVSECDSCETRRLHFFDGRDRELQVEREPALVLSTADVRVLVATELRTMTEPNTNYWEARAIVVDALKPAIREISSRSPGQRILTEFSGQWFAISDTELLTEAPVLARVAERSEVSTLARELGAPTEWHELDEQEWLRDKANLDKMLDADSQSASE